LFFLDFFCGGIMSCFSAETRWAPMLGVSENLDEIPEHERKYSEHVQVEQWSKRRQGTSSKTAKTSKVVNPLTRALTPPFIGRRRDFYIPKITLNSKTIPSVNT
jgi:hypothetical protein